MYLTDCDCDEFSLRLFDGCPDCGDGMMTWAELLLNHVSSEPWALHSKSFHRRHPSCNLFIQFVWTLDDCMISHDAVK